MKRIELLCNGCVRPIMDVPFYKCSSEDQYCDFVLHEWCTRLPAELPNYPDHPRHTLVFVSKVPGNLFGIFDCRNCMSRCNGFAYGCTECDYYIDVNCGYIPEEITHEAHPDHILSRCDWDGMRKPCVAEGTYHESKGKTIKNFKDDDHPDLLKLPFPDQTYSILQHWLSKESGSTTGETSERNLINHISHDHQHVLSLVSTQPNDSKGASSSSVSTISCHDPMKRIELLCNGCVRPIMDVPFYKCSSEDQHCDFVLHEWCTRLPAELPNYPDHPRHTLVFVSKVP
nr:zinc finger, PHD-type [Tanacetum cinerariifolium]